MSTNQRRKTPPNPSANGARTLAVDIGGSGVKAMILNAKGRALTPRERVETPRPATPKAILESISTLAEKLGDFDRVSVGFPGVVRNGVVENAPNLHPSWNGVQLSEQLGKTLNKPTRVMNDAEVQGFGAITGSGVELVLTLGTGVGSALFHEGRAIPNLEVAHHRFRRGKTYEEILGNSGLKKKGKKKWNKFLRKAIKELQSLFNFDTLAIGGGNAKKIKGELPGNVRIVPNIAGLLGGVALWRD